MLAFQAPPLQATKASAIPKKFGMGRLNAGSFSNGNAILREIETDQQATKQKISPLGNTGREGRKFCITIQTPSITKTQ